jgi:hypothetical protein
MNWYIVIFTSMAIFFTGFGALAQSAPASTNHRSCYRLPRFTPLINVLTYTHPVVVEAPFAPDGAFEPPGRDRYGWYGG